ncbi:putative aspartyl aminopeptidase [Glycine soja]|uniref:aspartyl aminopeptidase n=1 Tax=Glycine soja TaxID=3848 RepID=A0A445F780_GLYSO|nr:probable aspartyl aminopeptidase [Glycine soja]RZB44637.1 putative aspartyl aminopeptidase [Glycine soja]
MMYVMTEIKMRSESEVEFKEKMASITGPQILLHSGSPWLKQTMKPSSSPFLLFPKHTPRRTFCSINSNSKGSSSIVPDLLHYLNHSWTQFHATAEAKRQLLAAGFHMLDENHDWHLKPGGRYFFTRNMSCLVAFAIGDKYNVGDGFHVIAAHTDSPCLKLKPKTASCKCNYSMVNVQTYGAGLWYTWFDRDLSVAGRVILRSSHNSYVHKLVKINRPILRIPTLAIHLDRTVNQDGFKPNLETHLHPLLSMKPEDTSLESNSKEKNSALPSKAHHHRLLMQVLSDELNCDIDDIVNIELNVCDTQPSCLGGGNNEFIFSGRLDNLASSYCALRALIDSCQSPGDLASESAIRMVALFDNEEVGSGSVQGAGAPTMFQAMRRIVGDLANNYVSEGSFERTIRQSFLVSADMAHGVHPNFMDKHEELHRPELQKGLVIKHNANQRYATSGITSFLFKEVGKIHNLPTQEFAVRNDMGCGSTIGPILASGVGIRTVDCGIAQLSMHSIREICGKEDIDIAYKHFKAFYQNFSSVDKMLTVDT